MRSKLRDEFAAAALTGLLAGGPDKYVLVRTTDVTAAAYRLADAMMAEGEFKVCPECGTTLFPQDGIIRHTTGCHSGWPTELPPDVIGS